MHTGLAGVLGATVGGAVGLAVTYLLTGAIPTAGFTTGLLVLVVYMALLGSLPPAIAAAWRDPVRILRVP